MPTPIDLTRHDLAALQASTKRQERPYKIRLDTMPGGAIAAVYHCPEDIAGFPIFVVGRIAEGGLVVIGTWKPMDMHTLDQFKSIKAAVATIDMAMESVERFLDNIWESEQAEAAEAAEAKAEAASKRVASVRSLSDIALARMQGYGRRT
jgi:hypothetical protein